jgi:SAM-dependent methyltransferase
MDAESWDLRYAEKEWLLSLEPCQVVVELVSPLKPGRALELGAGEGRHAVWLARHGWRVTAVDFSRVALEKAGRRAREYGVELDCLLADVRHLSPRPGAYDLVLLAYMHPEPGEREAVFAASAEAVAPGGHLLVVGLDLTDPRAGRGGADRDWRYTPDRLSGAFPGIELSRCERVTREVETAEGSEQSVDTLAWGRRPDGIQGPRG